MNLAAYYIIGLPVGVVLGFKTSLGVAVSFGVSFALYPFLLNPLIVFKQFFFF